MVFERHLHIPYLIFLNARISVLLILASQRINYNLVFGTESQMALDGEIDQDHKEVRGPPPTPVEWTILAWIFGES